MRSYILATPGPHPYEQGDMFSDIGNAASSVVHTVTAAADAVTHSLSDAANSLIKGIPGGEQVAHDIQNVANQVKGVASTLASLTSTIPVVGSVVDASAQFVNAVSSGNIGALSSAIQGIAHDVSDVVGFVPGIGTALATAMDEGLALLNGGGAVSAVMELLLSNPPLVALPKLVKDVLRAVASMVDDLLKGKSFTDVAIAKIKSFLLSRIPDPLRDLASQGLNAILSLVAGKIGIAPTAGKIAEHISKGHQVIHGYAVPKAFTQATANLKKHSAPLKMKLPVSKPAPKHILMKLPPRTILAAPVTVSPTILAASVAPPVPTLSQSPSPQTYPQPPSPTQSFDWMTPDPNY